MSEPFEDFSAPEPTKKPRSRLRAFAGRLFYRLKALYLINREQAEYFELRDRYEAVSQRLQSIEVVLAITRAERDAAREERDKLALVAARDRERVESEIAMFAAKRERNKNAASDERRIRATGDD